LEGPIFEIVNEEKSSESDKKKLLFRGTLIFLSVLFVGLIAFSVVRKIAGIPGSVEYYSTEGSNVLDMKAINNSAVLLTQTKTIYVKSSGSAKTGSTFSYSDPVLKVNKSNVLVYDRGGVGFRVERNGKHYYHSEASGNIVTAAISRKNAVAYSVDAEKDSFSQSVVYIKKSKSDTAEKLYSDARDYCIALSVSDNDRYVACAFLGVDETAKTTISIIIVDSSNSEIKEIGSYKDCRLVGFEFISENELVIILDTGIFISDNSGKITDVTGIESTDLRYVSVCPNGLKSIVTCDSGNIVSPVLTVFDSSLSRSVNSNLSGEIDCVSSGRNYSAISVDNSIFVYNDDGILCGRADTDEKCRLMTVADNRLFVLFAHGLYITPISLVDDGTVPLLGKESDFNDNTTEYETENTTEIESTSALSETTIEDSTVNVDSAESEESEGETIPSLDNITEATEEQSMPSGVDQIYF